MVVSPSIVGNKAVSDFWAVVRQERRSVLTWAFALLTAWSLPMLAAIPLADWNSYVLGAVVIANSAALGVLGIRRIWRKGSREQSAEDWEEKKRREREQLDEEIASRRKRFEAEMAEEKASEGSIRKMLRAAEEDRKRMRENQHETNNRLDAMQHREDGHLEQIATLSRQLIEAARLLTAAQSQIAALNQALGQHAMTEATLSREIIEHKQVIESAVVAVSGVAEKVVEKVVEKVDQIKGT